MTALTGNSGCMQSYHGSVLVVADDGGEQMHDTASISVTKIKTTMLYMRRGSSGYCGSVGACSRDTFFRVREASIRPIFQRGEGGFVNVLGKLGIHLQALVFFHGAV